MGAMQYAPFSVVKILLDAHADPHTLVKGMCVLQWAILHGNEQNVREWLVQFPSWNLELKSGISGKTSLLWAAGTGLGRAPMVQVLLNAGADIKAENLMGCSALSFLAMKEDEDLEAAQLLIDRGANVNAQSKRNASMWRLELLREPSYCGRGAMFLAMATQNGSSALHFAARQGHVRLTRLLLRAGADPGLQDAQKMTPLELARATFGKNFVAMEAVFAEAAVARAGPNRGVLSWALEHACIGRRARACG
jgi:ankyrin repeat protein